MLTLLWLIVNVLRVGCVFFSVRQLVTMLCIVTLSLDALRRGIGNAEH
jgi:hypothetical protein